MSYYGVWLSYLDIINTWFLEGLIYSDPYYVGFLGAILLNRLEIHIEMIRSLWLTELVMVCLLYEEAIDHQNNFQSNLEFLDPPPP